MIRLKRCDLFFFLNLPTIFSLLILASVSFMFQFYWSLPHMQIQRYNNVTMHLNAASCWTAGVCRRTWRSLKLGTGNTHMGKMKAPLIIVFCVCVRSFDLPHLVIQCLVYHFYKLYHFFKHQFLLLQHLSHHLHSKMCCRLEYLVIAAFTHICTHFYKFIVVTWSVCLGADSVLWTMF